MFYKFIFIVTFFYLNLFSKDLITPIPLTQDYDYQKALIGKKLFYDTRLSHDDTISCATCHNLELGGDDNLSVSFGINGAKSTRNSLSVFNSRYNIFQFWDGRANSLSEQISGPIHNPAEMGTNFNEVIFKLKDDEQYQKEFNSLYDDGLTEENLKDAIVEFEKALTTPNSKFDRYLRGEKNILDENELKGYTLFKDYGCISCHNGVNIGGNIMQKIGILEKFNTEDYGLYNITKNEEDKYYFKVPSLRNIELTSPYFHDGRVDKLDEAVKVMLQLQVGFPLEEENIENIVKFLKTLTGEKPKIIGEL